MENKEKLVLPTKARYKVELKILENEDKKQQKQLIEIRKKHVKDIKLALKVAKDELNKIKSQIVELKPKPSYEEHIRRLRKETSFEVIENKDSKEVI